MDLLTYTNSYQLLDKVKTQQGTKEVYGSVFGLVLSKEVKRNSLNKHKLAKITLHIWQSVILSAF
jgi:hypothetical protein